MNSIMVKINPVAKPRMTQRDKWDKRPCVMKYWAFKEELLLKAGRFELGDRLDIKFYIKMPKSWNEKKKERFDMQPHQQKPDKDNLEKGLLDAFRKEDCTIWDGRVRKFWVNEGTGSIHIKNL